MIEGFRVMKAAAIEPKDFKDLKYPLYASIKLDGIRCTVTSKEVLSSSNKPIPNNYIRNQLLKWMRNLGYENTLFDGELLVGDTFQSCTSGIMSVEGKPDFTFHIFDKLIFHNNKLCKDNELYERRISNVHVCELFAPKYINLLSQVPISNAEELNEFYIKTIMSGHEGIIVRSIDGPYKFGRATKKQGWMLKVKPFEDAEAKIVGFMEGTTNMNEATTNERGLTQRSTHQENKIPNGTLGKFLVTDVVTGVPFRIGTGEGLTHELRQEIWNNKDKYINKIIKYKTQKIGTKDKPRIPIFIGFRSEEDMTNEI